MKLPTFVRASDGKFYQDLVYQDHPLRRAWFVCFDDKEPAELVVRESELASGADPRDILKTRGFALCLKRLLPGRREPHLRFFGVERDSVTGEETPVDGHKAISWLLLFKKGVPLPAPNMFDSCVEIFSYFPNKAGVYFGD